MVRHRQLLFSATGKPHRNKVPQTSGAIGPQPHVRLHPTGPRVPGCGGPRPSHGGIRDGQQGRHQQLQGLVSWLFVNMVIL